MKPLTRISTLFLLLIFSQDFVAAQSPHYDFDSLLQHNASFKSIASQVFDTFQIFGPEEPLELTVSTNFRALIKNKYKDEYQQATVIYKLWDSINISREIRIKPRGVLRLKVCSQPPLMINVKKTEKVFQLMDDLDKLKLVVPCKGSNTYQEYIFSEYLIYRLYNIITDNSFRVRMIRLHYFDTGEKLKPGHSYTFIIESHESLAKRQQSMPLKNKNLNLKLMDPDNIALFYLFQFMISNSDWAVNGLHNIKLIKTFDTSIPMPIAIPYDFDYAGLVNTTYAVPSPNIDVDKVTERAYLGHCLPEALMEQTFEHYLVRESAIMAAIEHDEFMPDNQRKEARKYLQEFFDIIKDPKRRKFTIINRCRN